ncbi:hypothetical protein BGZ76_002223 [Entomortierella beljakovae]|nr:hypothetical protein BGZ76_002223 [Entomortierella beljakovae]
MTERRARKRRQQEKEVDQDIIIEERSESEIIADIAAQSQDHTELEIAVALSLTETSRGRLPRAATVNKDSTPPTVVESDAEASSREVPSKASKKDTFHREEVKRLTKELHETTRKLRKSEELVDELKLHLKTARQVLEKKPVNGSFLRTDKHKRHRGKKLTDEERRSVLHCLELCKLEKNEGKVVSTADPIARTATYLGLSTRTVKDASLDRNTQDLRALKGTANENAAAGNNTENTAENAIDVESTNTENTTAENSTIENTATGNTPTEVQFQPLPPNNPQLPDQFGIQPDQYGIQPDQYGIQPGQYGMQPDQYGMQPDQFGMPNDQYGINHDQFGIHHDPYGIHML